MSEQKKESGELASSRLFGNYGGISYRICPWCKEKTLPNFTGSEDAVVCQNPSCRSIFNVLMGLIGRFTPGYTIPIYLPYNCTCCGEAYGTQAELRKHLKTHTAKHKRGIR